MFNRIKKIFKRGRKRKKPADVVKELGLPAPEEFKNDRKKGVEFIMKLAGLARKTEYADKKFNSAVSSQVIYEELQFEKETGVLPRIYFNPGYIQLRFDLKDEKEAWQTAEKFKKKGIVSKEGLEVVLTGNGGKKVFKAFSSGPEPFELGSDDAGEKVRQLKEYAEVKEVKNQ